MTLDKHGQELRVGDTVSVRGKVQDIAAAHGDVVVVHGVRFDASEVERVEKQPAPAPGLCRCGHPKYAHCTSPICTPYCHRCEEKDARHAFDPAPEVREAAPRSYSRQGPIIDPHPFVPGCGPQDDDAQSCGKCGDEAEAAVHRVPGDEAADALIRSHVFQPRRVQGGVGPDACGYPKPCDEPEGRHGK